MNAFLASFLVFFVLFAAGASAASHPSYAGFAQPVASCSISSRDLTFATGAETNMLSLSVSDDAVYRYAYASPGGQAWIPVTLSGSELGGMWLNGTVSGQLSFSAADFSLSSPGSLAKRNFVVVYTCSRSGPAWDCHSGWQIWQFNASLSRQDVQVVGVTASSYEVPNAPENSLDGVLSNYSRWAADGDGEWIRYELSRTAAVGYLRLAFYANSSRYFDIQYSPDGVSWQNASGGLASLPNSPNVFQRFDFSSVTARYVRILGHGSSTNEWNGVTEADINGFAANLSSAPAPECTSHHSARCYSGDVYWYDSCSVREGMRYGCNATQICSNGACVDVIENISSEHPNMFLNQQEIETIKAKISSGSEPWETAYAELIGDANAELSKSYYSVTKNGGSPTKNSYRTTGAYAWRCSENPCGVECGDEPNKWVICDGQYNPNADNDDYKEAIRVGTAVRNLGLAYKLTGDTRYAEKAIYFIDYWTTNSSTMMSPVYPGFQSKIELSITMPGMLYGADLLLDYPGWGASDKQSFIEWTRSFGENAKTWNETNNFENWRNVVLFSVAAVTGDDETLDYAAYNWKRVIPSQISPSGLMTKEINRADSLTYSVFAINGMVQGAEIARHQGIDLYDYKDPRGIGLKNALDAHAKYVANPSSWPLSQDNAYAGIDAALYEIAYSWSGNATYMSAINRWGRPMNEMWTMGPVTLTHSSGSYAFTFY